MNFGTAIVALTGYGTAILFWIFGLMNVVVVIQRGGEHPSAPAGMIMSMLALGLGAGVAMLTRWVLA